MNSSIARLHSVFRLSDDILVSGPNLPIARMPASVHYRHNNETRVIELVIDPERKPMYKGPTRFSMHCGIQFWNFRNGVEGRAHFVQKLGSESGAPLFVPECCFRQILFRLRPNPDFQRHSRRRMSAITSVAGRPRFSSTA